MAKLIQHILDTNCEDPDRCFLCSCEINDENRTREDVVPQWCQRSFGLRGQSAALVLRNGTSIRYRQVLVPCCNTCNNEYLSQLENRVRGYAVGEQEPVHQDLWFWCLKMYFGILITESRLLSDQANPESDRIMSRQDMEQANWVRLLLQGIRKQMEFPANQPGNIKVYKILTNDDLSHGFDLWTSIPSWSMAVRIGKIGVLASFNDCGLTQYVETEQWRDVHQRDLHPLQFSEVAARFHSGALRVEAEPSFTFIESDVNIAVLVQPNGLGGNEPRVVDEGEDKFPTFFGYKIRIDPEKLVDGNRYVTYIHDENGNFAPMSLEESPLDAQVCWPDGTRHQPY